MMRILVVGDFSPQARLAHVHETPPSDVLGEFVDLVGGADLAVVNLEAPLCTPFHPIAKTGPALHGSVESANFLKEAGFGLCCLANNHIMDYGADGLSQTMDALEEAGLPWVGAGTDYSAASRPFLAEYQDQTIAFLNFAENEWSTTFGAEAGAC